jgi:hypothetical protein
MPNYRDGNKDFSNEVMCMSYLYSKLPETGVSPHIGTGGSRMREIRTYGSVRGASSNGRPYRNPATAITLFGSENVVSSGSLSVH